MTSIGHTADGTWNLGVRRAVPLDVGATWALITSPEAVSIWLAPGHNSPSAPTTGVTIECQAQSRSWNRTLTSDSHGSNQDGHTTLVSRSV